MADHAEVDHKESGADTGIDPGARHAVARDGGKPGDGSAREQAASCQKVLGGWANIAFHYATKRYRSNLINWGMLPLLIPEGELPFGNGDWILLPDIRAAVLEKRETILAFAVSGNSFTPIKMTLGDMTEHERQIIADGCLINFNQKFVSTRG